MSNSVWPHRWQPMRLPCPRDSPGKNTGVGCHFFLQCMKVKSESEVAQLCPTPSDPMDCSLPSSSVHGIFQARVLEWGAIAFSMSKTMCPNRTLDIFLPKCALPTTLAILISDKFTISVVQAKALSHLESSLSQFNIQSIIKSCSSIFNIYS